jgi:two-component sensor histidine kinase
LVAVGAGLLVFFYERRQRQEIIRKLEMIRQMNHHVRNSLQVIATAASISEQQELAKAIHSAVGRIEWALREVLPGQREDLGQLSFQPTVSESNGKTSEDRLAS